jgi:hypothetical protein
MINKKYKKKSLVGKSGFGRSSSTAKKPNSEKANIFLIFKEKLEVEWKFSVSETYPETKKRTSSKKNAIVNQNPAPMPLYKTDLAFEDPDFEPFPWKRAILDDDDD